MAAVIRYSRSEVASRNGRDNSSIWVIIRDNIYDVTDYVNEHPGGLDPIEEMAGKDATKEFDSIGHSSDAREIVMRHKIGEVLEEEKYFDENGKKKKRVIEAAPEVESRSCLSKVCCGLLG